MGLLNFKWIGGPKRLAGATPLLLVEGVSVRLGQRLALDDVNLEVYEGEQVYITGPNGAGKSTLFNAITGVLPVTTGRVVFLGDDISRLPAHERARRGIRYMRQRDNVFPSLTVRENLKLALGAGGYERFAERFPDWVGDIMPNTPAGMLSGGQKQKLAWGMVLLQAATLILSDEASAGASEKLRIPQNLTACIVEHD